MTSCHGCRVLRKGCNKNCILRSSLEWIAHPDGQANATLFLVKCYGRAGLMNLIGSAPESLRAEIFKSLLYDACGRVIDPVYGAVGLMGSGQWARCQEAVAAVLCGEPIMQLSLANPNITPHQVHNYTIHNFANEAGVNNSGLVSTEDRQPLLVNYFEHPQTQNFEAGSTSSSKNNNNNEEIMDLSLGNGFNN